MPENDVIREVLSKLPPETREKLIREVDRQDQQVAAAFGQDRDKTIEVLKKQYEAFLRSETIEPGQLVVWKPGLKNRRRPVEGEPGIVIEVLGEPIFDTEGGPGSAYYRERLDIRVGLLDKDGDFLVFHFDSQRFMPFVESTSD